MWQLLSTKFNSRRQLQTDLRSAETQRASISPYVEGSHLTPIHYYQYDHSDTLLIMETTIPLTFILLIGRSCCKCKHYHLHKIASSTSEPHLLLMLFYKAILYILYILQCLITVQAYSLHVNLKGPVSNTSHYNSQIFHIL